MDRYNDAMTTWKVWTKTDHRPQKQYWQYEDQQNKLTRKQKWEENQLYELFKLQTSDNAHEKPWRS